MESAGSCNDKFGTGVDAGVSSAAKGEGDCRAVVNSAGDFHFFRDIVDVGSVDTMGAVGGGDGSFAGVSGAGLINVVPIGVGNGDGGPGKYFEVFLTGLERRLRGLLPDIGFFSLLSFFVVTSESGFFSFLSFFVVTSESAVDSSLLTDSAPCFLSISMVSSEAAVAGVVPGDAI